MFLFQISNYDDPALDMETAELFRQRLEAHSRRAVPFVWNATDKLNARSAKGPGREGRRVRYRIYGVLLLALGIFVLVPGLTEPKTPGLILAGAFAIIAGLLEFCLARRKQSPRVPERCRKEAEELLSGRRAIDWSKTAAEVCFDETGMTVSEGEKQEAVPYGQMTGFFETDKLWLVVYADERGLLLQKKDLISGEVEDLSPYLHCRITAGGEH